MAIFVFEAGPVVAGAPPWAARGPGALDVVRVVVLSAAPALRRHAPEYSLGAMTAAYLWSPFNGVPLLFGFYAVGAHGRRGRVSTAVAAVSLAATCAWLAGARGVGPIEMALPVAGFGGAWFMGRLSRVRADNVALLTERAERLERDREQAVERAAQQERERIARELHDIVAHRVSMMTVQAGAARVVAGSDPAGAVAAIARVEDAGRAALTELRQMLGVLRGGDDATGPQPGIDDLASLVDETRRAGVEASVRIEGETREVAPAVGLSVYRIVQEALTNVVRHAGAGASAEVVVRYEPGQILVEVADDGAGPSGPADGGHGVVGMRERALALGGRLEAGPRVGGGFVVRAGLPA